MQTRSTRQIRCSSFDQNLRKRATGISLLYGWLIFILLISGCTATANTGSASDIPPAAIQEGEPAAVNTPFFSTTTALPFSTATAIPSLVIPEGEPLPDDLAVITSGNISNLKEIGRWGNGVAYDMEWSPDGQWLAISTSRYLLLIDVMSMAIAKRIETPIPLYRIVFSADSGKVYGGGTQGKLLIYDITGNRMETIHIGNILPVTAVGGSHNGRYVITADWQNSVYLWDVENKILHSDFATTFSGSKALGFSADDEIAFSWSPLEPIKGWHLLTVQQPEEYYFGMDANQHTGSSVRISMDGNAAAVNQTWQIRVQNLLDGTTIGVLKDFYYEVEDLDVTADGEWTFSLHDDQVRIWQSRKSKVISNYALSALNDQNPGKIRVSPDGVHFVLLGQDLIFFDVDQETFEISQTEILPVNLATDLHFAAQFKDNVLYQMGLDGAFHEIVLESGENRQNMLDMEHQVSAYTVSETQLAIGYDNRMVELHNLDNLEVTSVLSGLAQMPISLLISEGRDILVIQTEQRITGIWKISSGSYFSKQEWGIPLDDLRLSADGRYLLGSGDGLTQVYDLDDESLSEVMDGRLLSVTQNGVLLQRYGNEAGLVLLGYGAWDILDQINSISVDSAEFSADGSLLAVSGEDFMVRDVEQSEIVLQMKNPARGAELFFSSDGRVLFFIHADGSMILFGVPN